MLKLIRKDAIPMKKIFIVLNVILLAFVLTSCFDSGSIDNPGDKPLIEDNHYKQPLGSDSDVYRINITTKDGIFPSSESEVDL